MTARPISSDCARYLAHKARMRETIIRTALWHHEQSGRAASCFLRVEGSEKHGMPPEGVFAITFSHGFADERNNGWSGLACMGVTNQKDLNQARRIVDELILTLRAIDCEWIQL